MGMYVNFGNQAFTSTLNGGFVDKSRLIEVMNEALNTEHQFICVSRARRFGKSIAAKMLCAYYDISCHSRNLFANLEIASSPSFEQHLNRYPVLFVDMTNFVSGYSKEDVVDGIQQNIIADLKAAYPNEIENEKDLLTALHTIVQKNPHHQKFIMIIDEWDAICREYPQDEKVTNQYINLLRKLFKSANAMNVFAGVYMTGILPIKKYNTQSALNNFDEYTMIHPDSMAGFFGFTNDEVHALAEKYRMNANELKQYYDGYKMGNVTEIYNPYAVMLALRHHKVADYWTQTDAYENLRQYISMNFDGLRDSVVALLAGNRVHVNVLDFSNDIHEIKSRNAVLTLLIHLGYLAYDEDTQTTYIPNREVRSEFERTIDDGNWKYISRALQNSETLLHATLAGDSDAVAHAIDAIHQDNTSILQYNDENSLACVLTLAFQAARKNYVFVRELPAGKGFADIVLIPRRDVAGPAIVLELKYNHSAQTAIAQILENKYCETLKDYAGDVMLVGINYDKKSKRHECMIKKVPAINLSTSVTTIS